MANKKTYDSSKLKKEKLYIVLLILLLSILVSVQLYLVKMPSDVSLVSEIMIFSLININLVLLLVLVYLVIRNVLKVFIETEKGAKLKIKTKLVFSFLILSIAPAFLLFAISSTFISTSLERWFNVQIERSLDESLKVAKTFYKNLSDNALFYSQRLSLIIKENKMLDQERLHNLKSFVTGKKTEYNLESVEVFSSIKEPLAILVPGKAKKTEQNSTILQDALIGKDTVIVEESDTGDIVRASVPIYSNFRTSEVVGVVVVSYHIPHSMVSKMQIISETYTKYKKQMIFRKPLKSILIVALLVTTLVIIFISIWFGLHIAKQITDPLDAMTFASKKVSDGDFNVQVAKLSKDEIGDLSDAFNKMLNDLRINKEIIESQSNYLKILMNKVLTGIISINTDGSIVTINESIKNMFCIKNDDYPKYIKDFLDKYNGGTFIYDLFVNAKKDLTSEKIVAIEINNSQKYFKVDISKMFDDSHTLLGYVAVFDDITESIRFEKMLAWREVARKVAHEIKNPLTPIQLSASRLKKKYEKYINDEDKKTYNECIDVIISQVDDIKNLINEFSNYGRMPSSKKGFVDIKNIISETLSLFLQAHRNIDFSTNYEDNIPLVYCDKEQIKRVIMNLLTNSIEAIENRDSGKISINLRLINNEYVFLSIIDNGKGIKKEYKERLFEPYFSRKKGGTGLGLYIVNSIISEHNGKIEVKDAVPTGTEFCIYLPLIKEKG